MKTLDYKSVFDFSALIEQIVQVLKNGNKVFVPSDAGYVALTLDTNIESIEKIRKHLKYTDPATFLYASNADLMQDVFLDEITVQLIEEYLPESLIIELEGANKNEGKFIRVRYPDHNLLNSVASVLPGILIFELDSNGTRIPYSDEQVVEYCSDLIDKEDLFLKAGVLDLNYLPAIVKIFDNQLQIKRPGEIVSTLITQFSIAE